MLSSLLALPPNALDKVNMEKPATLKIFSTTSAKIGLMATAGIIAAAGISSTPVGQRLFAGIGISDTFAQTTDAADRMVQKTSNAVQAFLGRSPGPRGATDTLKGKAKPKMAENSPATSATKPTQRALGKTFDEPLQSLAGPMAPAAPIEFLPLDTSSSGATLPAIALPIPVGGGFFSPVTGGFGGGIGGGGGGGGGGGDTPTPPPPAPPPPPPPIAAAVPEPSTWMLLLIGFAAVGASLRRAKSNQNSGSRRAGNCATAS